jgi:hypothetical protein
MARIIVTPRAARNLERMITTHSLPDSTPGRFKRSVLPLEKFPLLGSPLGGRWAGYRFILGPWRWMIVVYEYLDETDTVAIVTVQDGRSARSATSAPSSLRDAGAFGERSEAAVDGDCARRDGATDELAGGGEALDQGIELGSE